MTYIAAIRDIFQPLVDFFNEVIVFFFDTFGLGWGASIIALTVCVRALLLPLALKSYSSMRGLQEAAPQIKALQEKYKDDKQRLQQETMKFYKENQINPFASCLPLVAQLPVFLALFYALRTDMRDDICHQTAKVCSQVPNPSAGGALGGWGEKFLFIPDITDKATGWVLAVLIALYIGSQLFSSLLMMTAATDKNQRMIFLALPFVMTLFIFNFPAGLIVYWITTNLWTIGQQQVIKRILGPPKLPEPDPDAPAVGPLAAAKAAITGEQPEPAKSTAAGDSGRAKAPPPPPRRKRKRSGRRR